MPKDDNDMIGFQDFLVSQEEKRTRRTSRQNDSGHEILTFLEKENERLDRLSKLYTEKVQMIKNYPQDAAIIVGLEKSLVNHRNELKELIGKKDSHFLRNLREVYKTQFSS